MEQKVIIKKSAGIIISNKKLLVVRHKNREFFISPGGKPNPGETVEETLIREIKEEVCLDVEKKNVEWFGKFSAVDAEHPERIVEIEVFMIKKWSGAVALNPDDKIGEFRWINSSEAKTLKIGSVFEHNVIPKLLKMNFID